MNSASSKIVLIFFLGCSVFLATSCEKKHQTQCLPIVAAYPTWNSNKLPIAEIPWQKFTHLAVTFVIPNSDGTLNSVDADKLLPDVVKEAHKRGKKVYVSVGGAVGYADAFQQITRDETKLSLFSQHIKQYIAANNLDGVDIDWEFWTKQAVQQQGGNDPIESKLLVKLLERLRKDLPRHIVLTTDIFAGDWFGEQYLSELQAHVNYVVLMAYDFTGAWESSPIKHHADYSTFKRSIDYVQNRGFQKEKIIVGIPAYGIEFIDGKNKRVNKDISFASIASGVQKNHGDINAGKIDNLYYETPELVLKKSQYIVDQNLAGVLFFELTQDTKDSNSLLSASNQIISPELCREF